MNLLEVIKEERIKLDMAATTKAEALAELVAVLYADGVIEDAEDFLKDVYLRETEGMTGIGNYIAIPHGKSKSVKKTSLVFGKTKAAIEWETIDDLPVRFIILFAVNDDDKTSSHIKMLAKVAGKLANEQLCKDLLEATKVEDILNIFSEK
jgi:fructose-specific phosphotransferase system IIA component